MTWSNVYYTNNIPPIPHSSSAVEKNAIFQGSMNENTDPITDIAAHMRVLELSSLSVEQSSNTTFRAALTWDNEAVLLSYAEFKGVDPERDVKMLNNTIEEFKCVMNLFVIDECQKKLFSVIFTPYLLNVKKLTDSRKRVDRPRSKAFCQILSRIKLGRRTLIYSFSQHLAMIDISFSVHTRVDTLARLLPFFFEIVYEKMFHKNPAVFKRRDRDLRPNYHSPSVTDCIKMLLSLDKNGLDTIENAKVSQLLHVLIPGIDIVVGRVSCSCCCRCARQTP